MKADVLSPTDFPAVTSRGRLRARLRLAALLALLTCLGGLTPIAAKMAVVDTPPLVVAWLRFGVAGVLLYLTIRARGTALPFSRRDLLPLAGLALLCVPVN